MVPARVATRTSLAARASPHRPHAQQQQTSARSSLGLARALGVGGCPHCRRRQGVAARAMSVRRSSSFSEERPARSNRGKAEGKGKALTGKSGNLYSQYLELLGEQGIIFNGGEQKAPSHLVGLAAVPAKTQAEAKAGRGEIVPTKTKKRSGGNGTGRAKKPTKKVADAQRQFFRQCIIQNRLDLATNFVEALNKEKYAFSEWGMGYQSLLSTCVRMNRFESAVAVYRKQVELTGGSNAFAYSMLISLAGKMSAKVKPGQGKGVGKGEGAADEGSPRYIHTYMSGRESAMAPLDDETKALSLLDHVSHFFELSVREDSCNVVVCNAALDAYSRNACGAKVFRLHERMRADLGIEENAETFNILMQTAARTGDHALVFALRDQMRSLNIEPSERTFSILLASAAKLQRHQRKSAKAHDEGAASASEIGDGGAKASTGAGGIHPADTVLQSGVTNWAFSVLHEMKENGIRVNNHILSALFTACATEGKGINRCKRVLFDYMANINQMGAAAQGNLPNANVWCSFIKLCGACGEIDLAIDVCEKHCDKPLNPYVRSSLCSAIATVGARADTVRNVHAALTETDETGFAGMEGESLGEGSWDPTDALASQDEPMGDHSPFERYCKKAIKWHNGAHKEYLMRVFIGQEDDGAPSGGEAKTKDRTKQALADIRRERDETVACNAVIHMCAVNGLVQQAFRAYVDMRRCDLLPDCTTFNSLIWGCSRAGQPQRAIKAYEHMQTFDLAPDEVTYGVLMDLYANTRKPDQCMKLFIKMKEEGITPNIVHYTSLINAYGKAGTQDSVQKSFLIYKMMKMQGIKPTEVTLSCLIDACRRIYDVDRAFQYFVDVCKEGIVPKYGTYHHLLKICYAHGRVEEALDLILEVVSDEIPTRRKRKETLDALIIALSREMLVDRALDLANRVNKSREFGLFGVSTAALVALCLSCCQEGYPLEALAIYKEIKQAEAEEAEEERGGSEATGQREMASVCNALVIALGQSGQYKDMIEVTKTSEREGLDLSVPARVAFITACCNAQLLHQARESFLALTSAGGTRGDPHEGEAGPTWVDRCLDTEEERNRVKAMFDTLIVSSCRGKMTELGLEAFDVWRSVSWELEKQDSAIGTNLRLSSVTLAFLESCCRRDEALEWRVFDVCAEMRRQQYNKKVVKKELESGFHPKISHHFDEHPDLDIDEQFGDIIREYE